MCRPNSSIVTNLADYLSMSKQTYDFCMKSHGRNTATFNLRWKMAELSTQSIAIQDLNCTISDGRLQPRRSSSREPGDRVFFSSKIS